MDSFGESALSAYFPGLVDICIDDEGQLVYAIRKGDELVLASEYLTETESFSIPERKHFQYEIPRASEVMCYFGQDDESLYEDLLAYLKRFSALDDEQWAIVTHYVFLTYLHDHPGIDYCGYLLFHAVPERGKSRTGKSVVYVAFRGIHLVELREATIFRYSQNLHGTLFFDLQDISRKAERTGCEDILLLRAEKGAKCCRVLHPDEGPFNDTVYFEIYGPTIIASNEELHKILETRCLPIIMPNRPGDYENPRPEFGVDLKERLTAWRARNLHTALAEIKPIPGISGRLWDITKPLFIVNSLLPVSRQILTNSVRSIAGEKEELRKESLEGRLVTIIKEITEESGLDRKGEWHIKTSDIRSRFNRGRSEDRHVSPQWIGKRLKSMSFHNRIVNGYSEIRITADEYSMILSQYGYPSGEFEKPTNFLPKKAEQSHDVLRVVESGRESLQMKQSDLSFESPGDREFHEEREALIEEMMREGGKTREEAERLLRKAQPERPESDDVPF